VSHASGSCPFKQAARSDPSFPAWSNGSRADSFCYPIARTLGSDRPFYALDPYRFDGLPVPPSFEAIAAAHVKSLRAVEPVGPYALGGWCNGGLLAYEMARQLHADGQVVEDLVLLDPVYRGTRPGCDSSAVR
jgi:thioesterase domain-containing protein